MLAAVRGTDFPALPDGAQARPFDFDSSPGVPADRVLLPEGRAVVPASRSRTAFVDARDIGRVAAEVFTAARYRQPGHVPGRAVVDYRDVWRVER